MKKNEDLLSKHSQTDLSITIAKSRRKLFATAIFGALVCISFTLLGILNGQDILYANALAVTTSGAAFILSLQIIARQKLKGVFPRLYAALGFGLGLWFAAEIIWSYYEVVAGIETPFPSIADAFWLIGYAPFFYFLAGTNKDFVGIRKSMTLPVLTMSSIALVLLGNILLSVYQEADLTSQEGLLSYIVGSAYPIADMFLIVPAIGAFIQMRMGKLTFTPWAFIVATTLIFIIADIGFMYSTLVTEMAETVWIWNPLYQFGYIAIASALFWHKSFFTIDEKKLERAWQEKNR